MNDFDLVVRPSRKNPPASEDERKNRDNFGEQHDHQISIE